MTRGKMYERVKTSFTERCYTLFDGKMFTKGLIHTGALFNAPTNYASIIKIIFLLRNPELCEVV